MTIDYASGNFYSPKEAESLAKMMNDTDDWTYVVFHDPKGTGYSFIKIFDEAGEFVGKL